MENKLNHILLVDDSASINFFNKKVIERTGLVENISIAKNGAEALTYFNSSDRLLNEPKIIFLDINMPIMNGWEFLDHYDQLLSKNSIVILMLGSDLLPDDREKVKKYSFIKGGSDKMLNREFLFSLVDKYVA